MNDLYETTLQLARDCGISPAIVSREAKVGLRWYHKLLRGEWGDPGVLKIQRLHDYLQVQAKRKNRGT